MSNTISQTPDFFIPTAPVQSPQTQHLAPPSASTSSSLAKGIRRSFSRLFEKSRQGQLMNQLSQQEIEKAQKKFVSDYKSKNEKYQTTWAIWEESAKEYKNGPGQPTPTRLSNACATATLYMRNWAARNKPPESEQTQPLDLSWRSDQTDPQLRTLPERLPYGLKYFAARHHKLKDLESLKMPHSIITFDVSYNRVEKLPKLKDTRLKELNAAENKLTKIPSLPASLESLNVSGNRSLNVTPDFSACTELKTVNLSGSSIVDQPDFSNCTKLESLNLSRCSGIHALPDLSNCRSLREVDMTGVPVTEASHIFSLPEQCVLHLNVTNLSSAVREQLRMTVSAEGYRGPRILFSMAPPTALPVLPLGQEVTAWRQDKSRIPAAGSSKDKGEKFDWGREDSKENAREFSQFLGRLRETSDYVRTKTRSDITQRVCALLDQLSLPGNEEARRVCFAMAKDAVETCGDRVALAFLDTETYCANLKIEQAARKGTFKKNIAPLIDAAKGMYRLEKLRKLAEDKVGTLNYVDPIEVHLGYIVGISKNANSFKLPVNMTTMLYPACSNIDEQDLAVAMQSLRDDDKNSVNEEFVAFLAGWSPFDNYMQREHADLHSKMERQINAEVKAVQARLGEELNNLDDSAPDYTDRCRQLKHDFDNQPAIIRTKVKRDAIVDLLSSKRIHANLY